MAAESDIIDCIQLINSDNVGPITFYKLLGIHKTPRAALEALPAYKKFRLFARGKAELELKRAEEKGIRILTFGDKDYPQALRQIDDAPPVLYARGDVSLLNRPLSLSIVGARNASINGRKTASRIAYELTQNGVLTISGMARGIDAAAHKGALYALEQKGFTAAVLGTGVDVPYPQENLKLYEQICVQGVVLSEFPLGTTPQANNFPRRNRIVAALSLGTLVAEATLNSGSLITARMALEQGKDIFAIPGAPADGRSQGPNKLIKDGAILVENAEDILRILCENNRGEVFRHMQEAATQEKNRQTSLDFAAADTNLCPQNPPKIKIIDYLNHDGVYVDEIIRASNMDAAAVALELLELEMAGRIIRLPGNKAALIK